MKYCKSNTLLNIILLTSSVLAPFIVLAYVWLPIAMPYYEQIELPSSMAVQEALNHPPERLSTNSEKFSFGLSYNVRKGSNAKQMADRLLEGIAVFPEYGNLVFSDSFDKQHATSGLSNLQLSYSGMFIPALLINAFDYSGDSKYLSSAKDHIIDFYLYERSLWLPVGFIWNDHAIASRGSILADFWVRYKASNIYNKKDAVQILEFVARTAAFLNDRDQYTFRTNHGYMQNIVLLKLSLYFPSLENMSDYKQESLYRILEQTSYFINDEGVVLEHSADYHKLGIQLIETAINLYRLADSEVPQWVEDRLSKGKQFYAQLKRPDGSLPGIGDTYIDNIEEQSSENRKNNIGRINQDENILQPSIIKSKAGYAVWWSGLEKWPDKLSLTQTAITWSFFPIFGHKHADELSLNIWAYGHNWISGVGYWPYTSSKRDVAIGWSGSNAPHYIGESTNSKRVSKALFSGSSEQDQFIDLVRNEESGFTLRRQILRLGDEKWIVLDFSEDKQNRETRTVWNAGPSIDIEKCQACNGNVFILRSTKSNRPMKVHLISSADIKTRNVEGSINPITGWIATRNEIIETPSIIVEHSSDELLMLTYFDLSPDNMEKASLVEIDAPKWKSAEEWVINIGAEFRVSRTGDVVKIIHGQKESSEIELDAINTESQDSTLLTAEFQDAYQKYGARVRPLFKYRIKVTYAICFFGVISILFAIFIFTRHRSYSMPINIAIILIWTGISSWLTHVYFVT